MRTPPNLSRRTRPALAVTATVLAVLVVGELVPGPLLWPIVGGTLAVLAVAFTIGAYVELVRRHGAR